MRKMLVVLMLVLPMGLCKAQSTTAKPVEPTAIGVVYRLDPASQELKALPNEKWKQIYMGSIFDIGIEVSGVNSTFHVKAGERTEFAFKTGSPEKVSLYRFDVKKNKRIFRIQKLTSKFRLTSEPIKGLPVEVSTYGERSFKLVPTSPLTPGEYAINIADEVYTFGVD